MTCADKLFPLVKSLTLADARNRLDLSEMAGITPAQASWSLHELHRTGKISRTKKAPYLWYKKSYYVPKPKPAFTEIIEDHIINCPARGYNGKVLLSECNFNSEHPDCQTCEEGLKCQS